MQEWPLRLLEATALLMVAWAFADAWVRGPGHVAELLAGSLFGLLVEQIAIAGGGGRPDAYHYGAFGWMITADVPFTVAASWGALLYAALKYSDSLGIPLWLRPAVDGLYALMLDLTMDVVAVHLGLWQWATPAGSQWFGVPYANFGGWLAVAVLFSVGVRTARHLTERFRIGSVGQGAVLAALMTALAYLTINLIGRLFTGRGEDAWPVGLLAFMAAVLAAGGLLWRRFAAPADRQMALQDAPHSSLWFDPAIGLPLAWHLSYLGIAALTGVFAYNPAILFLTGTLAVTGSLLAIGLLPRQAG